MPDNTTERLLTERLLTEGWIVADGDGYKLADKGHVALRQGIRGGVPGEPKLPVDSVRARLKPSIKKRKKR